MWSTDFATNTFQFSLGVDLATSTKLDVLEVGPIK